MVRDTIMILEYDESSRKKLAEIFQDKYKIQEVSDEKEGIDILRKHASSLAVVLVNLLQAWILPHPNPPVHGLLLQSQHSAF